MEIKAYLAGGKPLLFDGAMGTLFAARPGRSAERCELANLEHPEEILSIHRAYLEAGARAIKTNTFSVPALLAEGETALGRRVVEAGCDLAKRAAEGYGAYVFGDMGPVAQTGDRGPEERYMLLADWFLDRGITHLLVETLPSDEGIAPLARHIKGRCPEAFLLVSFAVGPDGATREGRLGRELFSHTAALPEVDAVGFNCVSGPRHLREYIKELDLGDSVLSVMPNAGYPSILGRRVTYQGQPDYFAGQLAEMATAGAAILGGCCGTTPDHIRSTAAALEGLSPRQTRKGEGVAQPHRVRGTNTLWDKLERGQRVVAVELDPPPDDDVSFFLEGVRTLRGAGADAITIADCPIGRPRADSSLLACKIKRELGCEPLPHLTCRDRNLNATKALLLGLSAEGVHNVLLVTGDPIPTEERSEVKSVFNFNSRKLARYVSGLNESTLTTAFRIFGALNVNARNFDVQLRLAQEKEENGISGFLTQPVLSPEALENLKRARAGLKGKLLGGIFPVVSYRNACFLNNEISGMRVSDEIVERYRGADREEGERLAVEISVAAARAVEPYTDGLYLMTPFRRVALIARILEELHGV